MGGVSSRLTWRVTDWRFSVGVVSGGHLLSHFFKLTFPPMFPLLAGEFGLNNVELGLLVTAASVGSFLQVPIGVLVDRFGGKQLFLFAVGLTSLGVLLAGLGPTYSVVLAFTFLSGIGQAAFHPADYALLDAATEDGDEGKSFGVHTFGGYAGFAVAPIVFGGIGFTYGWRSALLVTGAFGLVYTVFAAITMDTVHQRTTERASDEDGWDLSLDLGGSLSALFQPMILAMAGFYAITGLANAGINSFTPTLAIEVFGLDAGAANATLSAFFVAAAVSVLAGGVLADRYEPYRLIVACTAVSSLLLWGLVSGLVTVTTGVIVAVFVALGLFSGLLSPARDRLVNTLSGARSTGTSFGVVFTGGTVGATISPVLLGAVIDAGTPRLGFLLLGGVFLSGAVVMAALGLQSARPTAQPAD